MHSYTVCTRRNFLYKNIFYFIMIIVKNSINLPEKLFIVKFSIIKFIFTKINRKRGYKVRLLEITILNIKLWSY